MFMRNGVALKIEEKGKVILKLTFEKDLVLLNMLHVPNITKNLKYGPILSNKGFKLVFESDKFVITKGGVYVGKGYLDEGLFKLSVVTDDNVINNNNVGTSTTSVYMMNPSFLWHFRLVLTKLDSTKSSHDSTKLNQQYKVVEALNSQQSSPKLVIVIQIYKFL
ncbi:hypothetical protein Tco_0396220 [Tanacetum coccineum]